MKNVATTIKHSFAWTGLVLFNPQAVEYDIMSTKKKKSKKNNKKENHSDIPPNEVSEAEKYLMSFQNTLPKNLLDEFLLCEKQGIWEGDILNVGLFSYWLDIKRRAFGGTYFNI